jgi:hypothetical protein
MEESLRGLVLPVRHSSRQSPFEKPNHFARRPTLFTGTARTNAGLFEQLVKAKEDDTKGRNMWPWGRLQAWPTPENQVKAP